MTRFRLTDLELDFISLVEAGDDPSAQVVIAKAYPDGMDDLGVDQPLGDRCPKCGKRHKGKKCGNRVRDDIDKVSSRAYPDLERVPGKQNWVDRSGGLPSYIERIAKHLHYEKGMTIGHAIATAVNQCKKWAAGVGNVNPDTRAKAAKAIAQWEAKKAKSHVTKSKSGDWVFAASTVNNINPPGRNNMSEEITKEDLPDEVVEYIEALESSVDELVEKIADLEDVEVIEKTGDADKDFEAAIAKADPAIQEILKSQRADLKVAQDIAKAERDARLEREFIAKAEALPNIPAEKVDLAGLLRRAADALSPEDTEALEKVLKAADEQIATGALFAELGTGGAPTTIAKSVEAKASELRKSDPTLTHEQAIARVYEEDPNLYIQSLKEA